MKEKSLLKYEIFSIIFTSIIGTLLHFTYEFSNNNLLIGSFSAVNESTWEHLKLLFFPMFITTIIGYFIFKKEYPNYLCIKTKGIILGLSFIVVFFYTYKGILGTNIAVIDILSFFVAVFISHYYTYKSLKENKLCNNILGFTSLFIILICFIAFTYKTPHIGLFKDPQTNTYGIYQKK